LEIFRWKKVTLNNKITVLGFGGSSILENRGNLLILIKKFTNGIILSKTFSFDDLSWAQRAILIVFLTL
jgi:hypothetical protein